VTGRYIERFHSRPSGRLSFYAKTDDLPRGFLLTGENGANLATQADVLLNLQKLRTCHAESPRPVLKAEEEHP